MPRAAAQASTSPAPAIQGTRVKSASTVTVACKIPNGVVLQLCQPRTYLEETPGGSRERTMFFKVGETYTVRGPAQANGRAKGYVPPEISGGYALTSGIPADFFEEWLKQNRENPIVVNKMIFSHESRSSVVGLASERAGILSGFEPIDPDNLEKDERVPKSVNVNVQNIGTAERREG